MLTKDDIRNLKAPFSEDVLGIKVQSLNREKNKAMLVCYVQHTDVYERIEEVDPAWSGEILGEEWKDVGENGKSDMKCFVRYAITIKSVKRENVGDGYDPKGATSDAIKRTAMLFGVGRYLYDAATVWVPYDERNDKYRKFTLAEYSAALHGKAPVPVAAKKVVLISEDEAAALIEEAKVRGISGRALLDEIKAHFPEARRLGDLPAHAYNDCYEWIIRQPMATVDAVESETVLYEKLGIKREAVHAYITTMPGSPTTEAVARHLTAMRTSHKIDALRKLFANVAARSKTATAA